MSPVPRKRFGQHFLRDRAVIGRILEAVAPRPEDHLVEIGPGRGAITFALLPLVARLDAVELDRDLIDPLARRAAGHGALILHQADALRFDFSTLAREGERLRLVGNLPYNISTPLLFHLLAQADCLRDLHVMLQQEVADRLVAAPGSRTYGRLSVMVQTWCRAQPLFGIPAEAFFPPPQVASTFLRLLPHNPAIPAIHDRQGHARLVAQAFSQRRKTLRNTLKGMVPPEQLAALGIDPGQRAEQLEVATFAALANAVSARAGESLEKPTRVLPGAPAEAVDPVS